MSLQQRVTALAQAVGADIRKLDVSRHPAIRPSLRLDFINCARLDPRITFTRASGGGRLNASGQYEWLPANQPRFDFDPVTGEAKGLLIEEQRTNLLLNSSSLAGFGGFNGATITEDTETSPDGVNKFKRVNLSAGTSAYVSLSAVSSYGATTLTYSFFVKGVAGETVVVKFNTNAQASITASDGNYTEVTIAKKTVILNGSVQRLSITVTLSAAITSGYVYLGDRRGGETATSYLVWGAQLEAGSFPTSYIPTTTAQVTRAADVASVNTLSPWFNASEGTLFVEVVPGQITTANWAAALSNSATGLSDLIDLGWGSASGTTRPTRGRVLTGGVTQTEQQLANTVESGQPIKMAIAYAANSVQTAARGVASAEDTSAVIPVVDRLQIGRVGAYGYSPGHIRSIRYYPKRLSNTELKAMTA
jgi:hypothetical protein